MKRTERMNAGQVRPVTGARYAFGAPGPGHGHRSDHPCQAGKGYRHHAPNGSGAPAGPMKRGERTDVPWPAGPESPLRGWRGRAWIIAIRPATPKSTVKYQPGRPRHISPLPPLHRPGRRTARARRTVPVALIRLTCMVGPMIVTRPRRPEGVACPSHRLHLTGLHALGALSSI